RFPGVRDVHVIEVEQLLGDSGVRQDRRELRKFAAVTCGEDQRHELPPGCAPPATVAGPPSSRRPRALPSAASADSCSAVSSAHPLWANASSASRVLRSKGSPSAVPWTSTKRP